MFKRNSRLFKALAVSSVVLGFQAAVCAATSQVPTIHSSDFTVGRSWTWDYFEQTGKLYSTERYQVISAAGNHVFIEMSSAFDGTENLQPHERIEVRIDECLAAYKNPAQKQAWSIQMFYLENGKWTAFDPGKTLAFEEKFNCNPHVFTGAQDPYATVFQTVTGEAAFQQKLWRTLSESWFSMSGVNAGVALQKNFNSDPNMTYVMKRRLN